MIEISQEHKALAFLVGCPAWEGLYKAQVADMVKLYYSQLLDPSKARKDRTPDDFLRGAIFALQWAVSWPDQELNKAVAEALEQEVSEPHEEVPLIGGSRPSFNGEETHRG